MRNALEILDLLLRAIEKLLFIFHFILQFVKSLLDCGQFFLTHDVGLDEFFAIDHLN